jgi:hypothetical protein
MKIDRAFDIFGINPDEIIAKPRTATEAEILFGRFRDDVRKKFRHKAKELHPDVQGSHEKMVELTQARDILLRLRLLPKMPIKKVILWGRPNIHSTFGSTTSCTINVFMGSTNGGSW